MKYLLKKQITAKLVTLLLFAFCGSLLGFAQDRPTYEENSLYVKFKDNSNISAKKLLSSKSSSLIYTSQLGLNSKVVSKYGIQSTSSAMELFDNPVLDKTFKIQTNPALKTNIDQLIKELEKDPNIEYVERVPISYLMQVQTKEGEDWTVPNDPFYSKEYGARKLNLRWHLDLIRAQEAWSIQKGNPKMKIAVVDNAVVGTHEDLLIPGERLYNSLTDQTGSANPPANFNKDQVCVLSELYAGTCHSYDYSHGTHCAGAVGAINNNGVGISSVGGGVSLLGIGGPGSNPDVMYNSDGGVRWAANNGAKVISCSWGSDSRSFTQEQLMKSCYDKGIIVIAAAGNDNVSKTHYPAAYYPYVIAVGSVDSDKSKSSFSNYGQWVSINSPGGVDNRSSTYNTSIFSTTFCINQSIRLIGNISDFDGMRYDEMQGTSMATPVAAGAVSLLVSKDSSLNTDEIRTILQNTSQPVYRNNYFSEFAGVIDIYSALRYLDTIPEFGPKIPSVTITSAYDSALIEWVAPETNETLLGYNLYRNGNLIANNIKDTSYLDSNLSPGIILYSVEPIYQNLTPIRSEAYTTIKTFYALTIRILPAESGTASGAGKYEASAMALVEATPAEGYIFDHWEDASATNLSSNTKMFIRMSSGKILFAKFKSIVGNEDIELDKKGFSVSPNPAQNEVYIRSEKNPMQSIVISDTKGQIVFNKELSSNEEIINVQDWNSGLYTVRVTTLNGILTSKLIKK